MSAQRRFADPWPSRQPNWPAAPWLMAGTVLTAWFQLPREQIEALISRSLVPESGELGPSRLRFYELDYYPDGPDADAHTGGRFREAVVAFPATFNGTVGEISAHMWSDDDTYMHWGRDLFGWPILRAPVQLSGPIWSGEIESGATGHASVELAEGSRAAISVDGIGARLPAPTPAAWITPRLIASPLDEQRELLVVRPNLLDPGHRFAVTGDVELAFREPHPLANLSPTATRIEMSVGFTLRVGDQVERL